MSEGGAQKVADVPTSVVRDASLDHMGSDLRCQNEVMTTRNCEFYNGKTNDSMI